MTAGLHDLIFAVGIAVLFVALVPAVYQRSTLPRSTCLVTAAVVLVFVANYATMGYWYATALEYGNLVCWAYLLWVAASAERSAAARAAGPLALACAYVAVGLAAVILGIAGDGLGVSAHMHDLVFAVGFAVLVTATARAVWARSLLPYSTCLASALVCVAFVANYATMGYWYATALQAGTLACWGCLLALAIAAR
jgi:hypothetical protein